MEGVGLSEKAKTYQKSQNKMTARDKNGQNTKMEDADGRTRDTIRKKTYLNGY